MLRIYHPLAITAKDRKIRGVGKKKLKEKLQIVLPYFEPAQSFYSHLSDLGLCYL